MTTSKLTRDWIALCGNNGIRVYALADRSLATEYGVKHMRSGTIDKSAPSKEARGIPALACGIDELGNLIVLCADRISRQFN